MNNSLDKILSQLPIKGATADPTSLASDNKGGWLPLTDSDGTLNSFFTDVVEAFQASNIVFDPANNTDWFGAASDVQAALDTLAQAALSKSANLSDVESTTDAFETIAVDAEESTRGVVRLATEAELLAGTATGETPAVPSCSALYATYLRKDGDEETLNTNVKLTAEPSDPQHLASLGVVQSAVDTALATLQTTLGLTGSITCVNNAVTGQGVVGSLLRPYTGAAALTDALTAVSSGVIVVFPGSYTCGSSLLKPSVHWYFLPGAIVTYTGSGGLFSDEATGTYTDCRILGEGQFNATSANRSILRLTKSTTNVVFQARSVTISGSGSRLVNLTACGSLNIDVNSLTSSSSALPLLLTPSNAAKVTGRISNITATTGLSLIQAVPTAADSQISLEFDSWNYTSSTTPAIVVSGVHPYLHLRGRALTVTSGAAAASTSSISSGKVSATIEEINHICDHSDAAYMIYHDGGTQRIKAALTFQSAHADSACIYLNASGVTLDNCRIINSGYNTYSVKGNTSTSRVGYVLGSLIVDRIPYLANVIPGALTRLYGGSIYCEDEAAELHTSPVHLVHDASVSLFKAISLSELQTTTENVFPITGGVLDGAVRASTVNTSLAIETGETTPDFESSNVFHLNLTEDTLLRFPLDMTKVRQGWYWLLVTQDDAGIDRALTFESGYRFSFGVPISPLNPGATIYGMVPSTSSSEIYCYVLGTNIGSVTTTTTSTTTSS